MQICKCLFGEREKQIFILHERIKNACETKKKNKQTSL